MTERVVGDLLIDACLLAVKTQRSVQASSLCIRDSRPGGKESGIALEVVLLYVLVHLIGDIVSHRCLSGQSSLPFPDIDLTFTLSLEGDVLDLKVK